jgi:preprotein translocase subunit YajC
MPTATAVIAALMAATSTKKTTTGGSIESILFIVIVFAVIYFVFLRPRTQAARRQRDTLMEISVGDEVLTGAGIFGTVLDVLPDRVTLETAPGTRITVVRSTIARKMNEPEPDPDPVGNSVAEQNWHDEGHDGITEAAGWHDPSELNTGDHDADDDQVHDHDDSGDAGTAPDEPEADGAPGTGKGGGR